MNTILIKKSDVSNNTPLLNSLSSGEIAINIADGYLFFKKILNNDEYISKIVDIENETHVLNKSLSSFIFQYGNNTVSEIFGSVLGGYSNDISGGASTVVNGEDNDIAGNFSFIGNGLNNKIGIDGDYSFIAGGQNNLVSHSNVFTLGSNLSSHANDFTYVNNISSVGKIYGDGSELTGIVAGDTVATTLVRQQSANWGTGGVAQNIDFDEISNELSITYGNTISLSSLAGAGGDPDATTLVRSNSANWDSTYTNVQSNSANWDYQGTDLKALSGNWQSTYTTVQSNSANCEGMVDSNITGIGGAT